MAEIKFGNLIAFNGGVKPPLFFCPLLIIKRKGDLFFGLAEKEN